MPSPIRGSGGSTYCTKYAQTHTHLTLFAYIGTNADTRQKYEYALTHLKECVVKIRAALAGDILILILLLTSVQGFKAQGYEALRHYCVRP
jgi:hypothetical protein